MLLHGEVGCHEKQRDASKQPPEESTCHDELAGNYGTPFCSAKLPKGAVKHRDGHAGGESCPKSGEPECVRKDRVPNQCADHATDEKTNQQSVRVLLGKHDEHCLEEDLDIEPQGPFADIPVVVFDAMLHLIGCVGFPPAAVDLSQAGDSGFYLMP